MITFEEWEIKYFFEVHDYPLTRDYFHKKYGEKYSPAADAWIAAAESVLGSPLSPIESIGAIDSFHAWVYSKKELNEDFTIREAWDSGHSWGSIRLEYVRGMGN